MNTEFPSFSSAPGIGIPREIQAFEDPDTPRETLANLLAEPASRVRFALIPPRVVVHPNFSFDDLLRAAAISGSLGAMMLTNAGILLRLVELHYASASTTEAREKIIAGLAPHVTHENLLHLTLHHSPIIRSFTRDVLRWHVERNGPSAGLRLALRFSDEFGILVPADALESSVLELASLEDFETIETENDDQISSAQTTVLLCTKSETEWLINPGSGSATSEQGHVWLENGWWMAEISGVHYRTQRDKNIPLTTNQNLETLSVLLRVGLLRLEEKWWKSAELETSNANWRQVAGEGVAALIQSGCIHQQA